jgi:hypothetical protein
VHFAERAFEPDFAEPLVLFALVLEDLPLLLLIVPELEPLPYVLLEPDVLPLSEPLVELEELFGVVEGVELVPPYEPLLCVSFVLAPWIEEPLALLAPVVELCEVVALVLFASFLCFMSPIANAEPLASAMMDVTTNAGASLRILPPAGYGLVGSRARSSLQAACPPLDALLRASTPDGVQFLRRAQKKMPPTRGGTGTTHEGMINAGMG